MRRGAGRAGLASTLFFLSGATALTYQVVWFKRCSHVFGNSTLAVAAVVAGFLLGLGLGARALGAWADRVRNPLAAYGWCELGIALLALAVPFELGLLSDATAGLRAGLADHPLAHSLARLALAFAVLGPPCVLMGGTLPLLVRHFVLGGGGLGRSASWLYGINTLGAAAGCGFAGFYALPAFGLLHTQLGAVVVNLAVAALALLLARGAASVEARHGEDPRAGVAPVPLAPGLRLAAFTAGAAALLLQMAWVRQLALVLGGTTYAFSAVVLVVLLGIGLGSAALELRLRRGPVGERGLLLVCVLTVGAVLLGQAALPTLVAWVAGLRAVRIDPLANAGVCIAASAALELLPSTGAGVLFPLLVARAGARAGGEGRAVGAVYAWNTAGTTVGALLPGLALFPLVGSLATVGLACALYLATAVAALGARAARRRPLPQVAAWLAIPLVLGALDLRELWLGLYIYGRERLDVLSSMEVVMHAEGRSCDVLVTRLDGGTSLRVNGKVDASTYDEDQVTQLGTGCLPRLLRPAASEVLVIGFGSGTTAGASLLFPGTQRVDCVEIEAAVLAASPFFASINHSPQESPRFRGIVDDGRSWVQGGAHDYDLVITEPSNPWMAGVGNLFTLEFYRAVRQRLRPGGLLGQWLQTYSLSSDEYGLVLRTVLEVFPHVALMWMNRGDTMLLASDQPIVPGERELDRAQWMVGVVPRLRADLERYLGTTDVRSLVLRHVLLDEHELRSWVERGDASVLNTDWNARLEFDAPLHLFEPSAAPGLAVTTDLMSSADGGTYRRLFERLGAGPGQAFGLHGLVELLAERGRADLARDLVGEAFERSGGDARLEADRLVHAPPEDAEHFTAAARALVDHDPNEANRAAVAIASRGDHERSLALFEPLVERHPDSATLWTNLAVAYDELGRRGEAQTALGRALAVDPQDADALRLRELFEDGADPPAQK